jgi:hypothetical protein
VCSRKRWPAYLVALLLLLVCRRSERVSVSGTMRDATPAPADLFDTGSACDLCDDPWYQYVPSAPDTPRSTEPAGPVTTTMPVTASLPPGDAEP